MDDPSAAAAHVQFFPAFHGLHLVAILVARKETVGVGPVATQAYPGFVIPLFVCDVFLGIEHCPLMIGKSHDLTRGGYHARILCFGMTLKV